RMDRPVKRKLVLLGGQVVLGIGIVGLLFAFSERKMHRNNAFQRRHLPHPIELVASIDLQHETYYFAGVTDSTVYLGNYGAPLLIKEISIQDYLERDIQLSLSVYDL